MAVPLTLTPEFRVVREVAVLALIILEQEPVYLDKEIQVAPEEAEREVETRPVVVVVVPELPELLVPIIKLEEPVGLA
jgi:hypothetical protein